MRFLTSALVIFGTFTFLVGVGLLLLIFYPIILQEIGYDISHVQDTISSHQTIEQAEITPVDTEFGIVIPKIKANSKVIAQVDPYNEAIYEQALTKGVAQAKGSAFPNEKGNMFLFSHSSVNFYEAQKYNSIFYLLYKLGKGDTIDIYYAGDKYEYVVTDKKIVSPDAVNYLQSTEQDSLTLMTCWPPGTSLQRLLVQARKNTKTQ